MPDTLFSYSLRDFLLFSRETWSVLFVEFTQSWPILPGLVIALYLLTLMLSFSDSGLLKPVSIATQLMLLVSCGIYYWGFYAQINQHAKILAGLVAVQVMLAVFKSILFARTSEPDIVRRQDQVGPFLKYVWLLLLPGLCLFIVGTHRISDFAEWLLPGWYVGSSLILLLHLQLLNGDRWRLTLPGGLLMVEIMTLYLIEVRLWWSLIFMLTVLFGAFVLDKRARLKAQI